MRRYRGLTSLISRFEPGLRPFPPPLRPLPGFQKQRRVGSHDFDTMLHVFKMDMVDLGPLNLKEATLETRQGTRACQEYGKAIGRKFDRRHRAVLTTLEHRTIQVYEHRGE